MGEAFWFPPITTMKEFKKSILISILSAMFVAVLFLPNYVSATDSGVSSAKDGLKVTATAGGITTTETDLATMIGKTLNYFFGVLGVVFLTVILIGGYQWMTAGGNEEKVGKAKGWVVNGINGMIVIFLAYALVYTILAALKGAVNS